MNVNMVVTICCSRSCYINLPLLNLEISCRLSVVGSSFEMRFSMTLGAILSGSYAVHVIFTVAISFQFSTISFNVKSYEKHIEGIFLCYRLTSNGTIMKWINLSLNMIGSYRTHGAQWTKNKLLYCVWLYTPHILRVYNKKITIDYYIH